ncbi:MAG: hypothetical protein ACR65O_13515 [Methylomicrobium sp.]
MPIQHEGYCDHANVPYRVLLKSDRTGHSLIIYDDKLKALAFQAFITGLYPGILPGTT